MPLLGNSGHFLFLRMPLKTLGPYEFLTEEERDEENCRCGISKCSPLQILDKISFQIPAIENCCEVLEDLNPITEDGFTEAGFEINEDYLAGASFGPTGLCFDIEDAFPVADFIFQAEGIFEADQVYYIKVCVSGNTAPVPLKAFIGANESGTTFSGNGVYYFQVTAPSTGTLDWGIMHDGADEGIIVCFSCILLCAAKTWTGSLINTLDAEVAEITLTQLNNGNMEVFYTISAEIEEGCYRVKLENDCDQDPYISNCINVREAWPCTIMLKWRDNKNVFGFDYSTDANYYNYYRILDGKFINQTFPIEKKLFTLSNNTNVQPNAQVSRHVVLSMVDIPSFVQYTLAPGTASAEFYADNIRYVVAEGDFAPDWRKGNNDAAPVKLTLIDQDFDGINNYCG